MANYTLSRYVSSMYCRQSSSVFSEGGNGIMVAHYSASDWPLKQLILVVRKQARVLVLLLFLLLLLLVSVYSTLGIGMICCVQCILGQYQVHIGISLQKPSQNEIRETKEESNFSQYKEILAILRVILKNMFDHSSLSSTILPICFGQLPMNYV